MTVPELVPEASPRTQRAVFFSCGKILEVKQSSVKKERVFHTQECKMLHNSAEILILCIRISKFYNFNTLDNWGHKTPTQSKRKRTGKKG